MNICKLFIRCFLDLRRPYTKVLQACVAVFFVFVLLTISLLYGISWIKIKKISENLNKTITSSQEKYHKAAKVMLFFVVSYISQWWSYVIYAAYGMYGTQPFLIVLVSVIFTNLGGLFNFITNVFVKKHNLRVNNATSKSN